MATILTVQDLHKRFGNRIVLRGVSFAVGDRDRIGLALACRCAETQHRTSYPRNGSSRSTRRWHSPRRRAGAAQLVGVFVDATREELEAAVRVVGFDAVQLHGHETSDETAALASALGIPVWRALAARSGISIAGWPAAVLLDTPSPDRGGTGRTFEWSIASAARRSAPDVPLILAGGLDPGNVSDAIAAVAPWAVDVASGVESSPGVKDLALLGHGTTLREASTSGAGSEPVFNTTTSSCASRCCWAESAPPIVIDARPPRIGPLMIGALVIVPSRRIASFLPTRRAVRSANTCVPYRLRSSCHQLRPRIRQPPTTRRSRGRAPSTAHGRATP